MQSSQLLDRVDYIVGEVHSVPGKTVAQFYSSLDAFDMIHDDVTDGKGTFLARRRHTDGWDEH
jgi:hypothetical protein